MNAAIRHWIETTYQPWRSSPEKSIFGGSIGADGTLPLDKDTLDHFERRGIPVEGRVFEDLIEADLLDIVTRISSWLPAEKRVAFEETVAFGACYTQEPNACAIRHDNGYAILFDDSFNTLLTHALELYCSFLLKPQTVKAEEFPLALNTNIALDFFHVTDPLQAYKPEEGFQHRKLTDHALWFSIVFFVAHEAGHIMLDHLSNAPQRDAIFRSLPDFERIAVLQPTHREEFEADRYAIELLFEGVQRGGLIQPGADQYQYWHSSYTLLGWLFSVLGAIEVLSRRIGFRLCDTHPPAAERWNRIDVLIRERIPILEQAIKLDQSMRARALQSAESGAMPPLSEEMLLGIGTLVAIPSSAVQALREIKEEGRTDWMPSMDVFYAWINSPTPAEAKHILTQHVELMHPNVDGLHYALAKKQDNETGRAHILLKRLLLLQRCREIGIDAAFEELAEGRLGILPTKPMPASEIPAESLQRYQDTVKLLVNTNSAAETKKVIEDHPELLHPTVDRILTELVSIQPNEPAKLRVEVFRMILARCREVSVFRAILEAQVRVGF